MAIRPPESNSQGFTLIEMLTVVGIVAIIAGFALPSLLSLNKPLRDGSIQFKSHLSLVRSKAISSNQAYRILPKYSTRAEYTGGIPRNFVVEYADNCKVVVNGGTNGWQRASQFDLDLPENVGITDISSTTIASVGISNTLNWNSGKGICFDNRGIVATPTTVILKDFRGDNKAKIAVIDVGKVGSIDIATYGDNTPTNPNLIPLNSNGNPEF